MNRLVMMLLKKQLHGLKNESDFSRVRENLNMKGITHEIRLDGRPSGTD